MPEDFEEKLEIFDNVDGILYRYHAIWYKNGFIKDLSRVGRDIESVILVDDRIENFPLHTQNGILLNTWRGNMQDT